MFASAGMSVLICIDGGVTCENVAHIGACRPDIVVSGSAVFGGKGAKENLRMMQDALRQTYKSQLSNPKQTD
jgi:pentose-5-phosphate-3-epimerase